MLVDSSAKSEKAKQRSVDGRRGIIPTVKLVKHVHSVHILIHKIIVFLYYYYYPFSPIVVETILSPVLHLSDTI